MIVIMTMPDALKLLKTEFPVRRKVVVRRIRMEAWGSTVYGKNQITISINKASRGPVEILVHEWAHIRCNGVAHSECWGKEYARIYSLVIGGK